MDFSPHPTDCTKYYRCGSGVLSTFSCATGLAFDSNLKICNFKDQVKCTSSSATSSTSSS